MTSQILDLRLKLYLCGVWRGKEQGQCASLNKDASLELWLAHCQVLEEESRGIMEVPRGATRNGGYVLPWSVAVWSLGVYQCQNFSNLSWKYCNLLVNHSRESLKNSIFFKSPFRCPELNKTMKPIAHAYWKCQICAWKAQGVLLGLRPS